MRKISNEERDKITEKMANHLGVDNVIIIYGDHVEGKIDTMMCCHKEVDSLNFGENAIGALQTLLRGIDRGRKQEQTKTE